MQRITTSRDIFDTAIIVNEGSSIFVCLT
uniref:Uncharacterized protein n=1 Tax=Anguilla anguilla TaxID=7936 RepID=A0A0E9XP79_ANGAN